VIGLDRSNVELIVLNSAWETDHVHPKRVSLNSVAVQRACGEVRTTPKTAYKLLALHHPLDPRLEDAISNAEILETLSLAEVRFAFHGHVHAPFTSHYAYDLAGTGIREISAGTFNPVEARWRAGFPMGYNVVRVERDQLSIASRKRHAADGAWEADARWRTAANADPTSTVVFPISRDGKA
jgi:hypothetical protein